MNTITSTYPKYLFSSFTMWNYLLCNGTKRGPPFLQERVYSCDIIDRKFSSKTISQPILTGVSKRPLYKTYSKYIFSFSILYLYFICLYTRPSCVKEYNTEKFYTFVVFPSDSVFFLNTESIYWYIAIKLI